MGIYRDESWELPTPANALHIVNWGDGLITTDVYELAARFETRTNCFCCSCYGGQEYGGYAGSNDPYCRNHGFAGTRACELHEMPGDQFIPDVDTDLPTDKPMLSVQQERKRNEEESTPY